MKLLAIIAFTFVITLLATKLVAGNVNFLFAGNLGISVFLLFTGFAHFKFQKGMVMMVPNFFPAKMFLVYLTGIIEIGAAIGLMIAPLREMTAILLILFFMLIFFANINSSRRNINIYKADFTGPGMRYLYTERVPMQIILIFWTWFFGIYLH